MRHPVPVEHLVSLESCVRYLLWRWPRLGSADSGDGVFYPRVVCRAWPSLASPPREVIEAWYDDERELATIVIAHSGLYGPGGALPWWYTEFTIERIRKGNPSLADFLDLLARRWYDLLLRMIATSRYASVYAGDRRDAVSRAIAALGGLHLEPKTGTRGTTAWELIRYAGLLCLRFRSRSAIEDALADAVPTVPVRVDSFIMRWAVVPEADRTRLGRRDRGELGKTAILGERAADRTSTVRVTVGPLDRQLYLECFPGGRLHELLGAIVRALAGPATIAELVPVLRSEDVPPPRLAVESTSLRLGMTTSLPGSEPCALKGAVIRTG